MNISEKLRQVIEDSGMTRTFISREARIAHRSLNNLLDGDSAVRLNVADRLADFFNLGFVEASTGKRKRGSLAEVLHKELIRSKDTRYRISEDTGIDYAALRRFETEQTDIQIRTAEALSDFFRLALVKK